MLDERASLAIMNKIIRPQLRINYRHPNIKRPQTKICKSQMSRFMHKTWVKRGGIISAIGILLLGLGGTWMFSPIWDDDWNYSTYSTDISSGDEVVIDNSGRVYGWQILVPSNGTVDADDDGILDVCQIGIWNITVIQNGEDVTNYTTDTRCDVGFFMKENPVEDQSYVPIARICPMDEDLIDEEFEERPADENGPENYDCANVEYTVQIEGIDGALLYDEEAHADYVIGSIGLIAISGSVASGSLCCILLPGLLVLVIGLFKSEPEPELLHLSMPQNVQSQDE